LHGCVRHRQRQRRLVGGDDIDFERLSRAVNVSESYSSFHDRCSQSEFLKLINGNRRLVRKRRLLMAQAQCARRSRRTENAID
jgi:hypothetical protein